MDSKTELKLIATTLFRVIILLSSVYTFVKSGVETSCKYSRPGSLQVTKIFEGLVSKVYLENHDSTRAENDVRFFEPTWGNETYRTCELKLSIPDKDFYTVLNCAAKSGSADYIFNSTNVFSKNEIAVKWDWKLSTEPIIINKTKSENDTSFPTGFSCEMSCEFKVYEGNCKTTDKFNMDLFTGMVIIVISCTFLHLLVFITPFSIKNTCTISELVNLYIKLNNYFGNVLPEESKFCYDKNGELYKSDLLHKGNKVVTMSLNNYSRLTDGCVFYTDMNGTYFFDEGSCTVVSSDGETIGALKNKHFSSAVKDIFWYHEKMGYPVVVGDHCLNIRQIIILLNKGFFPQTPSITGVIYKNKISLFMDDIEAEIIKESSDTIKVPKDVKDILKIHNELFFGFFKPNEYYFACIGNLRFHNRPSDCCNSQWKMYGSDVAKIYSMYGITINNVTHRRGAGKVEAALKIYKEVKEVKEASKVTSPKDMIELGCQLDINITEGAEKTICSLKINGRGEEFEEKGEEKEKIVVFDKLGENLNSNVVNESGIGSEQATKESELETVDVLRGRVIEKAYIGLINNPIFKKNMEKLIETRNQIIKVDPNFRENIIKGKEARLELTVLTEGNQTLQGKKSYEVEYELKEISKVLSKMKKKKSNDFNKLCTLNERNKGEIMNSYDLTDLSSVQKIVDILLKIKFKNEEIRAYEICNQKSIIKNLEVGRLWNDIVDDVNRATSGIKSYSKEFVRNCQSKETKPSFWSETEEVKGTENQDKLVTGSLRIDLKCFLKGGRRMARPKLVHREQNLKRNNVDKKLVYSKVNKTIHRVDLLKFIIAVSYFKLKGRKVGVNKLKEFLVNKMGSDNKAVVTRWAKNNLWSSLKVLSKTEIPDPNSSTGSEKQKQKQQTGKIGERIKIEFYKNSINILEEASKDLLGKVIVEEDNIEIKDTVTECLTRLITVSAGQTE